MQSFQFKKDIMNAYRKKEIVNMAQENLYMFKRLKEKTSHYDFGKYDKEYDQAQYYKRSHCTLLPSIDFSKTKRNFSLGGKYKIIHNSIYNMNVSNSYGNLNPKKCNNINNNIIINNTEQNLFNNNLYKKKLEELKYEDFIDIKNNSNNGKNDETKNEEGKNEKNNDNINKNKIVKNDGNNIADNDNKKEKEVVNKDNDKKNEESDNNNEDNTKIFKKIESIDNENTN